MAIEIESVDNLLLVRGEGKDLDLDEAKRFMAALDVFFEERRGFVAIVDARGLSKVPADVRHAIGEHRKSRRADAPDIELGVILITDSIVVRGALTALSWVSGEFNSQHAVSDRVAARAAALEAFAASGLTVPETTRAALERFVAEG